MLKRLPVLLMLVACLTAFAQLPTAQPTAARSTATTARPWTYWWWMGSAVNEADLTRQLEQFAGAGLGGVHIIPIYGTRGYENQFIPFLSKRWLAVFAHTVREANRLGLGVDLTLGTGWPFGGPTVSTDRAAMQWKLENNQLVAVPTKQQVKRAGPGGQGLVLDYFSATATQRYLAGFDSTLVRLPVKPRAVYNDSYEVYGANWTTDFLAQFAKRRGYNLTDRLADFRDTTDAPAAVRVRRDYFETLSDLLRDGFTATWTGWARQRGYLTRNQAHGSPGNLLDLYALADIPETESFGSSRLPIPGLRVDENYEVDRFGTPHPLAMKFASSAAHLMGKRLVSSETGTWLADHFKVSLAQVKPQIDELFAAGINHVFYHGITYSPRVESWPGWLFYASTNFGPSSHLWPYLPLLNQYVERCQTRLQASRPDNDVLVYFPIHDLWRQRSPSAGGVHLLEVHHVERWLLPTTFGRLCDSLRFGGYSFDYVSDKLLSQLRVGKNGRIQSAGGAYRLIAVPPSAYLPAQTRQRLAALARQGVRVIYNATLPALREQAIRHEELAPAGLSFIRKKQGDTTLYFIANLGNQFEQGAIRLATPGVVSRYDPLTNQTEPLPRSDGAIGLRLLPGQSCFLTVVPASERATARPQPLPPTSMSMALADAWQFQFMTGKPRLNTSHALPQLRSWTTVSDSAGYFWGTGRYTTTFDWPGEVATPVTLNLGDVRDVAEVRLNGQSLGTVWCLPFRVMVPAGLLRSTGNRLEIDVTNLSANYMRLHDRLHPDWKKFYDINIVDIRYRPFSASRWEPMPSGLLGPVRLLP